MTEKHPSFVFYDPSGKRWVRFRRGLQTFGLLAGLLIFLLILSIFINPQLPGLGLPAVAPLASFAEVKRIIRGERPAKNIPYRMRKAARNIKYVRSASPVIHPKTAASAGESKPIVFGYYVNWDRASIVSLRVNLGHLTHLVPEWFTLKNAQGDLDDESDPTVVAIATQARLPIVAMVSNIRDESWQPGDLRHILNDSSLRKDLIQNIYDNLTEHKFAGVNIDFEQLAAKDRDVLIAFMEELSAKLKPAHFLITQSVPVEDPAYDLKRLASINDFIVPMVYDEHEQSSPPGPVASEEWFEDQLDKLAKIVPPEKTIIGFGGYGYDWVIGSTGGAEVAFGDVMAAVVANHASIEWDDDTENPVLRYKLGGDEHEVWFLDAVTALNEVQAVAENGFRGVGLWRLGAEDPGLWTVLKPEAWPEEKFDPVQLFPLTAQKSPKLYGQGEILRVAETPRDGKRNVWRTKDDYFEKYEQYPTYYVVDSMGRPSAKIVALSFDDGPDSKYTPQILDVLRNRNVHATFFVIGVNAEQNIGLIRREYGEGHEIGNHTYSHPNIAATSEERTKLELMWTQRILENAIGVSTTLFRPPYNADSEPQTSEEILPIWRAQQLNYVTIGERIDPRDWEKGATVTGILDEIEAEQNQGNIILLHDGGGDRSTTVAALPKIVDHFERQGYRFVLVSDLMGKTRAQVMPVPSKEEMRWAHIEGSAFDAKSQFVTLVGFLFLIAIYLTLLRSLIYGILAIVQKFKTRNLHFDPAFRPPVSVIVAAFNEEKVIARTVQAVLDNGYPALELVVVDDGSKDATLAVLHRNFGNDARVRILTQPNAGKSAALNNAIAHSQNDILIALDADTIVRRETIEKLVRHFADGNTGAVSGNARVGNRRKWITRFQSIEYIYGFNLDRRALDVLNAITVVPGAVGAWRRRLILELGGFRNDTLAEDTDLTLAIRREGYRIRYEDQAVAYTEAPEDTRGLARQRFRWAFGTLQAAWKHRDAMFVPKYGTLGLVALPSIWLFQVLLSALSPFAEMAMIIALFVGNWKIVLLYYLAFFALELLTGFLAYALEGEKPWDLSLLLFQRIYYRELMYYVLAKSLIFAMKGRLVGWGKLERRATVQGV